MTHYPTQEEIWAERPAIGAVKPIILKWKKKWWKGWGSLSRNYQLSRLYCLIHDVDEMGILVCHGRLYCYNPQSKTIMLDDSNPSVISTLHELGHHLYGRSELEACRFSCWLFKECFPKDFKQLKPKGHMLI